MKYYPTKYGVNHLKYDLHELNQKERDMFNEKLNKVIKHIPKYLNDYQKIKIVHDIVCRTCTYDYEFKDESYHVKSIFNHQAVCFGIAKWVHAALLTLGIKGNIICGVTEHPNSKKYHAWNLVELNDQKLYLDVTFDMCRTVNDIVSYDYFLLTTSQINQDHFW